MDALDLARWQFAITTVYHFLFVPITIGMSAIVAGFHTAWVRSHDPQMFKLTKFFGKLFVINFALGLVTGIVQEFQFGMNWSDYSRFVGDIFGAPLAFEALLTFFLESVFIGLWLFGWGRLPEKLHAMSMWLVHIGTVLSAYFILSANSFMQNPVGYRFNPDTNRAEMTDFLAVLFNKVQLVTFPHVITSAYLTGGGMVMAVALWHLRRGRFTAGAEGLAHQAMYRRAARTGAWVSLVAALGVIVSGDLQGKIMTEVQPMKMAAAEALYNSVPSNAGFSIFTIGSLDGSSEIFSLRVPGLLSFLATGSTSGAVEGIREVQAAETARYAGNPLTADLAGNYLPNIPGSYWSFRLMMGFGFLTILMALLTLWVTRKAAMNGATANGATTLMRPRWWHWAIIATPFFPVLGNSFGWIFTEIGRQPWIVNGLMTTAKGVSPSVGAGYVLTSMVVFTLLYGALAVIEVGLFLKYVRLGAEAAGEPAGDQQPVGAAAADEPLVYAY